MNLFTKTHFYNGVLNVICFHFSHAFKLHQFLLHLLKRWPFVTHVYIHKIIEIYWQTEGILSNHLAYPLFQITGLVYFIYIWLVNSIKIVELFPVCKQEMVSLTYPGSWMYGKQLKMGFMDLSYTGVLSVHVGEVVWKSKYSQAKNVFWFLSTESKLFLVCL